MKSCCVFIVWISASVCLALRSRSWFLFQGNATVIPHREEDAYFHQVLKAMDILRISVSYPTSWVFYKLCAPDVFFYEMVILFYWAAWIACAAWVTWSIGLDWHADSALTANWLCLHLHYSFLVNEQFFFFCTSWKHFIESHAVPV